MRRNGSIPTKESFGRTPKTGARSNARIRTLSIEGYTSVSRVLIRATVHRLEITLLPQQVSGIRRSSVAEDGVLLFGPAGSTPFIAGEDDRKVPTDGTHERAA